MRSLILIGFMGTGKSTVGRQCAARLGVAFLDSDRIIEERADKTIAHLFAEQGEAAFRQLERETIAELTSTPGLVIATGGGTALDPVNVANLRAEGVVVLLTATPDVILQRVGDVNTRPLLAAAPDARARIVALLAEREPHYRLAAHFTIDTSGRVPEEIAADVIALFSEQNEAVPSDRHHEAR